MRVSKRKIRLYSKNQPFAGVDLTAMLDVVFILLIFFILTSNVAQSIFDLELPKADENFKEDLKNKDFKEIKLTLFTNGDFAIDEKKVNNFASLKAEIKKLYQQNSQAKFLIIAENTLKVETMMELLTFLKSENITAIEILLKK